MRTVLDILRMANDRGEIGYAWPREGDTPTKESELPLLHEAERLGYIRWKRDASVGRGSRDTWDTRPYQRRDVYELTPAGQQFLGTR